jgi:hypothetical protein
MERRSMKQQTIYKDQKVHAYFKKHPGVLTEWEDIARDFHDLVHFLNVSSKPWTLGFFTRDLEKMFLARLALYQRHDLFLSVDRLNVHVHTHHDPAMVYVLKFHTPVGETNYTVWVPWGRDLKKNPLPYEPVVLEE